ncbi:protocadherin gamma-B1-like [Pleurodeles waltl]|uniref:protocadherin gamma-B1-like n=1 Tax=Pleurodeles waltl TaxID=8319 RepID=UPI003709C0AA
MTAAIEPGRRAMADAIRRQVMLLLLSSLYDAASGQISYSGPEEMNIGSVVGNIAQDIGLRVKDLPARKLRAVFGAKNPYFSVDFANGNLKVSDRIDREAMCGGAPRCVISFEIVVEDPLHVYHVKVDVEDINDNPPNFLKNNIVLEISEFTLPGARFPLGNALDPDLGPNALKNYELSNNAYFILEENQNSDGNKHAELVLEKPLDRENQSSHHLILTAYDGGVPTRSSTARITIRVSDANDNVPKFSQKSYKASLREGAPYNSTVVRLEASDDDEGSNAQITYSFSSISNNARGIFNIDPSSGEITIKGLVDFEETASYTMVVEAKDGGGLFAHCTVNVQIIDENDNAPEIILTTTSSSVPEDSPLGTLIALINVIDRDSGKHGEVTCHVEDTLNFQLISSSGNYYKLLTAGLLDREAVSDYNITIVATDAGSSPLSTRQTIQLTISDINDNPPVFQGSSYLVHVPENNLPGTTLYKAKAADPDLNMNSQITYSLINNIFNGVPVLSYVSVNSQTGVIYAQRSFDYEQLREFHFQVKAQDSGSPPLSSNVTVRVLIVDQNDNPPEILYPSPGLDNSALFEMVPPSSEPDSLVTKVVAVDADSGHNAWLSYHLQAPESSLFKVGLHTGEIRTSRLFREKDLVKQTLIISVKDSGQPPLSATVTVNVMITENLQEALPALDNKPHDSNSQPDLEVYLIIALSLISFLFLFTMIFLIIIKCRHAQNEKGVESLYTANHPYLDQRLISNYQNGTLQLPYSYEVVVNSQNNEYACLKPFQEAPNDLLVSTDDSGIGHDSPTGVLSSKHTEKVSLNYSSNHLVNAKLKLTLLFNS